MENFYSLLENIDSKSKANKIAIIGKGPSIKLLDKKLDDFIVINLNDSERIYAGDIAIVHYDWARESIAKNGFKAGYYLSSKQMEDTPHRVVKYKPDTADSMDFVISSFQDEAFYIEDFLVVSAIRLSLFLAKKLQRKLDVYLLGFDFGIDQGIEPLKNFSNHNEDYKKIFLKTQEVFFRHIKESKSPTLQMLNILHIGAKEYSDLTVAAFNHLTLIEKRHEEKTEFDYHNAYQQLKENAAKGHVIVVAEFTNNHVGDPNRLVEMVKLAKEAGADMIKVQKRNVGSFYTEKELNSYYQSPFGETLGDYRRAVELDDKLFELLDAECSKHEILWFASILDRASFEYMQKYDRPLIKLPSTISNHRNYLKYIAESYKGDIVVSTGFTDSTYEDFVLDNFANDRALFLLQCTSSYPTPPEACQIAVVRHYNNLRTAKYHNLFPGYSSHDVGSLGCMLSVSAGAKMIEKHVKLGNLDWVHFDGVALDLFNNEFNKFVDDIRLATVMSGSEKKKVHSAEHHKYQPNEKHN